MKTLLLTALLVGTGLAATAQVRDVQVEAPGHEASVTSARASELTRQMANRLHLNEAEYIRLRAANQIKLARMSDLQFEFKNDPAALKARLQELEAQYEQECRRLLMPSQLSLMGADESPAITPAPADPNENGVG